MNSYPKELEYLKRYLTPDGEIVCRPEAARRLLEATNDESDYIAPEMAQWTFDLGSQSVKPACIANDNCRIVFFRIRANCTYAKVDSGWSGGGKQI